MTTTEKRDAAAHAFAERYLTDVQREAALDQMEQMRQRETAAMARRVGAAFASIPGWDRLTVDDHTQLAQAIRGLPDDEVVARYNATALSLLTKRGVDVEANTRFETWKKGELEKERKAIRDEMAAELLKKEPAPDLSRAVKQPAVPDFSKMTDDEYNHWYVTEGSGKDLGLVR